jgi:hypothetical protein
VGSNPTLAAPFAAAELSDPPGRLHGVNAPFRPALSAQLTGAELRRWYWLLSELVGLARTLGVSTSGSKVELTERLCAVLDGGPSAPPRGRRTSGVQLSGPLDDATVIPPGQRCTEHLRGYFVTQIGSGFRFDRSMRDFIGSGAGRTLGEAVDHWRATRSTTEREIEPQFELNRFTRAWYRTHPDGSRSDLLTAWQTHRSLPAELRVGGGAAG